MLDKTVYQAALKMLARREYAKLELVQKLQRKHFSQEKINAVAVFLEQKNYLNDTRFAESYTRMRINKGYGKLKIQAELKQHGISNAIIQKVDMSDSHIGKVYYKKFGQLPVQHLKEKAKRINYLQYKGFSLEKIQQFIKEKLGK